MRLYQALLFFLLSFIAYRYLGFVERNNDGPTVFVLKSQKIKDALFFFSFSLQGASQCGPQIPRDFKARSHSLLITTSNFIVPLAVMSFCYYKIFREIHVHMDRIRKTSNIDLENSVQQQKKVATTLFLVLACFLLCWTPFVIYSNWAAFNRKIPSPIPLIMNPLVSIFKRSDAKILQ